MELSRYACSPLLDGATSPSTRGSCTHAPILLVAAERRLALVSKRLEHEYGLKAGLDVTWADRPWTVPYNDVGIGARDPAASRSVGCLADRGSIEFSPHCDPRSRLRSAVCMSEVSS